MVAYWLTILGSHLVHFKSMQLLRETDHVSYVTSLDIILYISK